MGVRPVGIVMTPIEVNEANGVTIRRTIGSDKLVLLDPFLLLDHMSVTATPEGASKEIGFPRHPHRGIETLTYVMEGRVHHGDSLGNDDWVGPQGAQWMRAGGGIFHSEMVEVGENGHQGLQLWVNLPAELKMARPKYRGARPEAIPEVQMPGGASVRVVAGTVHGVTGPCDDIAAKLLYADVHLPPGTSVTLPAPPGETAFAYVYRGRAAFGEEARKAAESHLAIFGDGDGVTAAADGYEEARFVFASAPPWREPVLQYRSLVMSSVDEMRQALEDLEKGTFEWSEGR